MDIMVWVLVDFLILRTSAHGRRWEAWQIGEAHETIYLQLGGSNWSPDTTSMLVIRSTMTTGIPVVMQLIQRQQWRAGEHLAFIPLADCGEQCLRLDNFYIFTIVSWVYYSE